MERYPEFIDTTDFPAERLLQVNNCGSEHISKNDYTILRSHGRRDYHFLYLRSGWLDGEIGSAPIHLVSGQCAVFLPGVPQMYTFSSKGWPVSYFVHFTGEAAVEAMTSVEPQEPMVYTIGERTLFEELFFRLVNVHTLRGPKYIPEENGILFELIAILARSSVSAESFMRKEMQQAVTYIREHFYEKIDLDGYAADVHISRSRFSHLFTQTIGVSPRKYIINLRMDKARSLLTDSTMSIAEVSENVGYDDPLYFSRLFSQTVGMSPKSFRSRK